MNLYNKLSNRPYIFLQITGISTEKFRGIVKN